MCYFCSLASGLAVFLYIVFVVAGLFLITCCCCCCCCACCKERRPHFIAGMSKNILTLFTLDDPEHGTTDLIHWQSHRVNWNFEICNESSQLPPRSGSPRDSDAPLIVRKQSECKLEYAFTGHRNNGYGGMLRKRVTGKWHRYVQ